MRNQVYVHSTILRGITAVWIIVLTVVKLTSAKLFQYMIPAELAIVEDKLGTDNEDMTVSNNNYFNSRNIFFNHFFQIVLI